MAGPAGPESNRSRVAQRPGSPSGRVPARSVGAWAGQLESIPFPFRTGILDRISMLQGEVCRHIDFDESGERILVAGLTACCSPVGSTAVSS